MGHLIHIYAGSKTKKRIKNKQFWSKMTKVLDEVN